MKKFAIVLMLASLGLVAMFGGVAEAAPTSVIVFNGTASLNSGFPCTGACSGTFSGVARGVAVSPLILCVACPMTASFTYQEGGGSCVAGIPVAPIGSAAGTYSVVGPTGTISGGFSWLRVGVTAVMLLSGPLGAGVAGFIPPLSCAPTTAIVAGVAVTV